MFVIVVFASSTFLVTCKGDLCKVNPNKKKNVTEPTILMLRCIFKKSKCIVFMFPNKNVCYCKLAIVNLAWTSCTKTLSFFQLLFCMKFPQKSSLYWKDIKHFVCDILFYFTTINCVVFQNIQRSLEHSFANYNKYFTVILQI